MLIGLLSGIIAGALVGMQNIFNSKVNEKAGSWATTTLVLGLGSLASFFIGLFFEGREIFNLANMQGWYWFSGFLGIGVITGIVQAIRFLGPTFAISIVLTSQLGFAVLWDSLGWMGLEKVPFTEKQLLGVLIILAGVIVFKWSEGRGEKEAAVHANQRKNAEIL
ncbi:MULTISPECIES: DMT family transporter [unclassified Mesobacillus]|uniref:DMT family transporter n=1 Tax=unclassified Mesobacillus TaxID=2675270 RepID=UPI0020406127|nr:MULTISPECIES: DMT family transporter [unclassified Mesobacillus]MCM3122942.1 DMT family transporter [Mesobacillus sp. MER 33]MCM3233575.1 DMT family transporter [Mesobacillus sp. MER 48]